MIGSGVFNSSSFRDGDQDILQVDKSLPNNGIYGSFSGAPGLRRAQRHPAVLDRQHNTQYAFQLNHTHVFSPTTLNR